MLLFISDFCITKNKSYSRSRVIKIVTSFQHLIVVLTIKSKQKNIQQTVININITSIKILFQPPHLIIKLRSLILISV